MFAEEVPSLLPLPVEPFRYYAFGKRTVHLDGFVEIDAAYYAPPPGNIGRELDVQWDGHVVRILDPITKLLMREHLHQQRGSRRMRPEDKPTRTPPTTEQLLARSATVGVEIGVLCRGIHAQDGELGVRSILGVLSLAKKYGPVPTNAACTVAFDIGVPTYRFVRRYLEHRSPLEQLALKQVDPLIRQLTFYRDLINLRTQEPS